ncbi:uncharacterized protein PG998_006470 [Apiospora kogelbergensis]|uniref:uncharacterized protein n=1 Tax=Apiospora kogelbergensis TaxID=1337665 RepID=UPI00312FFE40
MVFCALVKYELNPDIHRYIVTAPDADTMDEWWRILSEKNKTWKRHAPDFYSFTSHVPRDLGTGLENQIMVSTFSQYTDRMMGWTPEQTRANHVSGGCFYIRSKSDPRFFWYVAEDKKLYSSMRGKTRFCIKARDKDISGKVMIRKDEIQISCATDREQFVNEDDDGRLIVARRTMHGLKFGDFLRDDFVAEGVDFMRITRVSNHSGESWELVE